MSRDKPANPLWKILTLHCEEATRLSSDALDAPLSRADRIALGLHLPICSSCREFDRQIHHLHTLARETASIEPPVSIPSDEVRDRLNQTIVEG